MTKHEEGRIPAWVRDEPDGEELGRVWTRLADADPARVRPSSERPGDDREEEEGATPTDRAWTRLSERLGLPSASADGERHESPRTAGSAPERRSGAPGGGLREGFGRRRGAPARSAPVRRARPGWAVAAAAAALLLGGGALWRVVPVTHAAPSGGSVEVTLPDGSSVSLSAGSRLRHRRGFAWVPGIETARRAVRLEGEAFFDVSSGARPFEVSAGAARVTVLGTRFNVRARSAPADDVGVPARVDVEEGRVRVEVVRGSGSVELDAGEGVTVEPSSPELRAEPVAGPVCQAWRTLRASMRQRMGGFWSGVG